MKYSFLIFLSFFMATTALAQLKEKPSYKKIAQDFKAKYNKGDYENLYKLLSPDFQKRMTAATFKGKLQVLKFYVDEIKDFKYAPVKDTAAYQFDLGDGNFMNILLMPDLKINQLSLEHPKTQKKEAVNMALYNGTKKDNTTGEGTYLSPNEIGGSGDGSPPFSVSKFKNLEMPKDNGQVNGRIVVRAKIDKKGKVVSAVAGARGTTFADIDLYRECEKALLKATYEPATDGTETRTVFVPFTFRIK